MTSSRRRSLLTVAVGAAAASGGMTVATMLAVRAAHRRWAKADHPDAVYSLHDFESTTIETRDGTTLHVAVLGDQPDRPTVVLSHCWTGGARIWAPVARRLATDHRVVVYDHRGHGRSTIGSSGLTLDALAADLADLLEQLDLRDVVVAGHSMGGMTAQAFAVNHPDVLRERVGGIALVGTACDGLDASQIRRVAPFIPMVSTTRAVADSVLGPVLVRGTLGKRARLADLRVTAETFAATAEATRTELMHELIKLDLARHLPSFEVPVVVVAGTRDLVTPFSLGSRIAELIPTARLEVADGAGHMLPCEVPDVVASCIRELSTADVQVDRPSAASLTEPSLV